MNCQQVKEDLSRFYDGEMSATESRTVEAHVEQCESCRLDLAAFKNVSRLITSSSDTSQAHFPTADQWSRIVGRLDSGEQRDETNDAGDPKSEKHFVTGASTLPRRALLGTCLALAAALFVMLTVPMRQAPSTTREIAVDFSKVIERYAADPGQAMESLSQQYSGEELPLADATRVLGYAPTVATRLPADTKLVSTRVLKLPVCVCEGGQCICGPGGCNCTASLCRRSDGSQFLVLEHVDSKRVTFGDASVRKVTEDKREMEVIGQGTALSASWHSNKRRLTAIGLRNQREAQLLADAIE